MKTLLLDTNIILRFLLNDEPEQFEIVKALFAEGKKRKIVCLSDVLAEVVFVLKSVYGMPRKEISELMSRFVQTAPVEIDNKDLILWVMDQYGKTNLGYIDLLLLGHAQDSNSEVVSFDKKLMKMQKSLQRNMR